MAARLPRIEMPCSGHHQSIKEQKKRFYFFKILKDYSWTVESAIAGSLNDRLTKQHSYLSFLFLSIYVCHDVLFSFFHRKIHQVSSYFVANEVAHNYLVLRGNKCSSTSQNGESVNQKSDHSVIRVFLWPRNPVCGKSDVSLCACAPNHWNLLETSCSILLHSLNFV